MFWFFGHKIYGILVPQLGIESASPAVEGEVLTTGPPGKVPILAFSWCVFFYHVDQCFTTREAYGKYTGSSFQNTDMLYPQKTDFIVLTATWHQEFFLR